MRLTVTIFVGYFFMGIGKFQATDKYLDRWFISFLFFLNTDGWNHTNFGNSSDFGLKTFEFRVNSSDIGLNSSGFGLTSSDNGNSRFNNDCNRECGCDYKCQGKIPYSAKIRF